jgi:hypothetical protein
MRNLESSRLRTRATRSYTSKTQGTLGGRELRSLDLFLDVLADDIHHLFPDVRRHRGCEMQEEGYLSIEKNLGEWDKGYRGICLLCTCGVSSCNKTRNERGSMFRAFSEYDI